MNANESHHGCTEAIHPFGGLANTGSALNSRVYLRSSAADCRFWVDCCPDPLIAALGANTPWKRVRFTLGLGTRALSRASAGASVHDNTEIRSNCCRMTAASWPIYAHCFLSTVLA